MKTCTIVFTQKLRYSGKVWQGETLFQQLNSSANRLSNVTTNLDGFSLANHGQFSPNFLPAKLSRYTVHAYIALRNGELNRSST